MNNFFTVFKVYAIFALFLYPSFLSAQDIDLDSLPSMIGASNSGTLFYMTFHPTLEDQDSAKHDSGIRIYVASKYATIVTLEIKSIGKFEQKTTVPYDVIEFFLTPTEAQMYFKGYEVAKPEQVWKGKAIKISSDDPVICYGVARFYATSDGYMAIPVSSLGTKYQVASTPNAFSSWGHEIPSFTSIVGAFDDTHVTFTMGGNETSKALKEDSTFLFPNQFINRTLNEGDVWLIPGIDAYSELTGSKISADKPVAVFSGNQCGQVPTYARACDYMIEQELPMENWGKTYLVAPIRGRKKYSVVKIFASEPNTEVSINGVPTFNIVKAGGILGNGYIETRVNTIEPGDTIHPVVITGNKPINVVQFNPCAQDDNAMYTDPFQMQVLPMEQFQTDVLFNTPGIRGQYGFIGNFVNIVYKATKDGKIPDDMLWSEVIDGKTIWNKLSSKFSDPGLKFKYKDSNDRHYYSMIILLLNDGVYRIKAKEPFAAYSYGYDFYDSYGFPVAGCSYDLTTDEDMEPIVDWEIDEDGNIEGTAIDDGGIEGKIQKDGDEVQKVTRASGLSVVSMINALSYNYVFNSSKFIPGTLETVNFKLEIIDTLLPAKAVLAVSDRRGNDTILVFYHYPPSLPEITGTKTTFDTVKSNQESILEFTLINNKQSKTQNIKSIILKDSDTKFTIEDNISENTTLNTGESHKFKVNFKGEDFKTKEIKDVEGIFTNQIGYELENGKQYFFQEISAAVYNPRINVNDVNFATKIIGEEFKEEFITITNNNSTNSTLEIYGFEFPDDTPFKLELLNASPENPYKIKAGTMSLHRIKVDFMPESPGEYNATLKVLSDGYVVKDEANLYAKAMPSSVKDDELISDNVNVRYENGTFNFTSETEYQLNSVEVYDLSGRLIHTANSNTTLNNYTLKVLGLSSGVYVIKMKINNSIINKKVII